MIPWMSVNSVVYWLLWKLPTQLPHSRRKKNVLRHLKKKAAPVFIWHLTKKSQLPLFKDPYFIHTSSWLRVINCPQESKRQLSRDDHMWACACRILLLNFLQTFMLLLSSHMFGVRQSKMGTRQADPAGGSHTSRYIWHHTHVAAERFI